MLAVLHNNLLITRAGEIQAKTDPGPLNWSTGSIFQFCKREKITTLWITRGCDFWNECKKAAETIENRPAGMLYGDHHLDAREFTIKPEGRFDNMLTGWDKNGFRATVHFPGLVRQGWSFDEIEDPWLLFSTIDVYQDKLGTLPAFWQKAGKELFMNTLRQRPVLCSEDPDDYFSPFIEKMESEFIWQRPLTPEENGLPFVHAFDKRMMFLSAARGGMFGFGPYQMIGPKKASELGKSVGLVQIEKPKFGYPIRPDFAEFLGQLFSSDDKSIYVMTPYLSVFEQYVTSEIKIIRGWVWENPDRLFEKFAVKLGTAIKETRIEETPENVQANKAFKSIYTRFFGWLGRLENRTGYGGELFRPDWRALIVAGAGANLLRNVLNVWEYTGRLPFAINHDCIMYFSDSEHWELDFDKTHVADPNRFTHEWSSTGDKVRAAISDGLNPGQIEKAVQNGN